MSVVWTKSIIPQYVTIYTVVIQLKAPLNVIKLVHQRNSMHHLALLLVRVTCRNIGVHLSYKHSLIPYFHDYSAPLFSSVHALE